ncbi:MAG: ribosome-binding factor [Thermosipho sp. (in: thermotogales)]|nr:ribosome-binding factor [Thermosipho sp. (in: thermotogales)]MDN5324619.1 ribosome-binding factor [Thermosipho sp. (in: thermotogales)]
MKPEYRNKKIEAHIRNLISEALQKIKEPEFDPVRNFITVSRVEISKDKRYADVYISYLGDSETRKKVVELMQKYKGYFRTYVAKNTRLYVAPELRFKEDKGIEASVKINKLLDEISKNENHEENN